jgi:hypothetical protein
MSLRIEGSGGKSGESGMLPYSRLPGETRISCERTSNGVRLSLPALGTWHHAKWGLLFGSWMILPQTALLIFAVKKMGPQVLERIWKPLLLDATLMPFFGVIVVSFMVGFVLGKMRTTLLIDADSLTLVRELWGMKGSKSWKKEQLKDVRTFFKHIRIVSKKAILRTQFGVASTKEAKWLARCLREELGMEPATPAAEPLQRAA